jgi:hypothetical protein
MKPTFGTLEWGKKNNGVLTRTEQFHFLGRSLLPEK